MSNKLPKESASAKTDEPVGISVLWRDENGVGSGANYFYLELVWAFWNSQALPHAVI